jgi:hypothetical protein
MFAAAANQTQPYVNTRIIAWSSCILQSPLLPGSRSGQTFQWLLPSCWLGSLITPTRLAHVGIHVWFALKTALAPLFTSVFYLFGSRERVSRWGRCYSVFLGLLPTRSDVAEHVNNTGICLSRCSGFGSLWRRSAYRLMSEQYLI